ncbi:MAG: hypothetical protein ACMG6S_03015 [Byssovorax sp.]
MCSDPECRVIDHKVANAMDFTNGAFNALVESREVTRRREVHTGKVLSNSLQDVRRDTPLMVMSLPVRAFGIGGTCNRFFQRW